MYRPVSLYQPAWTYWFSPCILWHGQSHTIVVLSWSFCGAPSSGACSVLEWVLVKPPCHANQRAIFGRLSGIWEAAKFCSLTPFMDIENAQLLTRRTRRREEMVARGSCNIIPPCWHQISPTISRAGPAGYKQRQNATLLKTQTEHRERNKKYKNSYNSRNFNRSWPTITTIVHCRKSDKLSTPEPPDNPPFPIRTGRGINAT